MSPFIDDGFSIEAKIKFQDGEVSITYRPPIADELQRVIQGKIDPTAFLASKIISWSGPGMDQAPPTAENIKRLHARLWGTILDTVCGYDTEGTLKNS